MLSIFKIDVLIAHKWGLDFERTKFSVECERSAGAGQVDLVVSVAGDASPGVLYQTRLTEADCQRLLESHNLEENVPFAEQLLHLLEQCCDEQHFILPRIWLRLTPDELLADTVHFKVEERNWRAQVTRLSMTLTRAPQIQRMAVKRKASNNPGLLSGRKKVEQLKDEEEREELRARRLQHFTRTDMEMAACLDAEVKRVSQFMEDNESNEKAWPHKLRRRTATMCSNTNSKNK